MDLSHAVWRTSTRSGSTGECVEVADNLPGIIAVRDSKDPAGGVLMITPTRWGTFLASVKADQVRR